jgi:hypothetical protein
LNSPQVAETVECFLPYTTIINHSKGTGQLDLFGAPAAAVPVINANGMVEGVTVIYAPTGLETLVDLPGYPKSLRTIIANWRSADPEDSEAAS